MIPEKYSNLDAVCPYCEIFDKTPTRNLARKPDTLQARMFWLGCVYNFGTLHKSLRLPLYISERQPKWVQRTPAIAVGWTDQRWRVQELLVFKMGHRRFDGGALLRLL